MPRKSAAARAAETWQEASVELPRGVARPPRQLGKAGAALWKSITTEYDISTSANIEALTLACEATDTAAACQAQIATDGVLPAGKEHPLLKVQLANRSFVVKTMRLIGLD